ncbi:MAG: cytidine deaminase [Firmicutes bacterium]|nr:cytidine deaminase [Bacillota bacterium]
MTNTELVKLAIQAREKSYSPYSNFMVGAALLASSGKVYQGCNIENAGYTATVCAERTAFFKAKSEGETNFVAIAVAGWHKETPTNAAAFPCGVCRQVMREFCDPLTFKIIVANKNADYTEHTLEEILPNSFGPQNL